MNRKFYASFLLAIVLFACQREFTSDVHVPDNENAGLIPGITVRSEPIIAPIQGMVYDETGLPAVGAAVAVGKQVTIVNEDGFFRINDAALDKVGSFVRIDKPGYFPAFRSLYAHSATNQLLIKLIKKERTGTIQATKGGEVELANGSKLNLPTDPVIVVSTGKPYKGQINVYAAYIDPTSAEIAQTIPGSLMADDKNDKRVSLASFGMMAVELESASNEKLQIAPGKKAVLTMPIPPSLQSAAPANIPLWYINEQTGIWKEDGSAARSGNNYVGEVSHFSFWNCDMPLNSVMIDFSFKTADNKPLANTLIRLKTRGPVPRVGYNITDAEGKLTDIVPGNTIFDLSVIDACNTVLFTSSIGAFKEPGSVNIVAPAAASIPMVTIKGSVASCSGKGLPNSYAVIKTGNTVHAVGTDLNGNFIANIFQCNTSTDKVQIYGVDATTLKQGTPVDLALTGSITNAGQLPACDTAVQQYIKYTIDDTKYLVIDSLDAYATFATGNSGYNTSLIVAHSENNKKFIQLLFESTGETGTSILSLRSYGPSYFVGNPSVTITHFPKQPGEFYEGVFSANFTAMPGWIPDQKVSTILGSFRVRRRF